MKLNIFKEITGKTQGIKFNSNPPMNAEIRAIVRFKTLKLLEVDKVLEEK